MVHHARVAVLLLNQSIDNVNRFRHKTWPSNLDCLAARSITTVIEEIEQVITILQEQMALEDKS
jgi:hypothetical protein